MGYRNTDAYRASAATLDAQSAETRLAKTLARLEELQRFAEEQSAFHPRAHDYPRQATHGIYAEELAEIIRQAR